jgi:hypothetical protein
MDLWSWPQGARKPLRRSSSAITQQLAELQRRLDLHHEVPFTIVQDQMTGFADDPLPQLEKHPHGFLLTDPR